MSKGELITLCKSIDSGLEIRFDLFDLNNGDFEIVHDDYTIIEDCLQNFKLPEERAGLIDWIKDGIKESKSMELVYQKEY